MNRFVRIVNVIRSDGMLIEKRLGERAKINLIDSNNVFLDDGFLIKFNGARRRQVAVKIIFFLIATGSARPKIYYSFSHVYA